MSEWMSRLIAKYTEVNEGKFLIPEEIPANERTAFHGAAAAASKAGKSHFTFNGKKHPVTMKKDTAKAIADDVKEAKCTKCDCDDCECEKNEAYNEPQGQAKRMMSPLQKMRMDKEKADRDRDGKLKPRPKMKKEDQDLDEVLDTPKAMDSYRNKAKASKEKAASSAAAKMVRSKGKDSREHPAAELKTMAKRTSGEKMADRLAKRKTLKKLRNEEVEEIDEISKKTLGNYVKKASKDAASKAAYGTQLSTGGNTKKGGKMAAKAYDRTKNIGKAVDRLAKEAYENIPKATHKGPSSPPGEGLSPSAKDQLAKKMPTPEPIDEPKVDAKNFKTFRKGLKQAKKRPGDK